MFIWLVYMIIILTMILSIIGIGFIILYCVVNSLAKKVEQCSNDPRACEQLIDTFTKKKKLFGKVLKKAFKKKSIHGLKPAITGIKVKLIIGAVSSFSIVVILVMICMPIYEMELTFNSIITSLLINEEDKICTCYAKCIADDSVDSKSTYEILFGYNELEKLMLTMNLTEEEEIRFELLTTSGQKNKFLLDKLTIDCVTPYRNIVTSLFRDKDGKDRTLMTDEELLEDLTNLLNDPKYYGRGANCEVCGTIGFNHISTVCYGEPHYVKGFSWDDLWGSDDDDDEDDYDDYRESTVLGKATGDYAVKLDDGLSYYWYHQTSYFCGCKNCGDWTTMKWGTDDGTSEAWHKFGKDGCAVYSLAMIVSNLTGQEITPTKLLSDLGCKIENGYCDTAPSGCFNRRNINRGKVAEKVSELYGIHYEIVNTVDEMNSILKGDGMIWDQWRDSSSTSPRVWLHGSSDFSWYANKGHFMAVREIDANGNYYCLTSCSNGASGFAKLSSKQVMNSPESPDNVLKHSSGGAIYAFWVDIPEEDNDDNGGGGGGSSEPGFGTSDNWYSSQLPSKYSSYETVSGEIKLYDGLPWVPNGAYLVDTDASTTSLYAYVKSVSGVELDRSLNYSLTANGRFVKGVGSWEGANSNGKRTTDYLRGSGWSYDSTSKSYINDIEGIKCLGVAIPPTIISREYNNGFSDSITGWKSTSTPSATAYNYGNKKMALVLKADSGVIKYLPVTTCDAKGHTFPGGVCQSNVKAAGYSNGVFNVAVASTSGDAGGGSQSWALNELGYKLNNVVTAGANPVDYMYNVCETYGWDSSIRSYFSKNYRVVGYVVWP